jgi:hypothetical protein
VSLGPLVTLTPRDQFGDDSIGIIWRDDWLDSLVDLARRPEGGSVLGVCQYVQNQRAVLVPAARIVIEPVDELAAALEADHD